MKKHSGIFAACAAVVLLAGTACYFSGVPYYLRTKRDYSEVLSWHPGEWQYADMGTITDGQELTVNGVRLIIPKEMTPSVWKDGSVHENMYELREDGARVAWAMVPEPDDLGEMPLSAMGPRETKLLKSFLDENGKEFPRDWASLQKLTIDLDMTYCNIHSYAKAGTLYYLAELKESWIPTVTDEVYYCDDENGCGLIQVCAPQNEKEGYKVIVDLFSPDTPNQTYCASVSAKDRDTAIRMANSFTIVGTEPK